MMNPKSGSLAGPWAGAVRSLLGKPWADAGDVVPQAQGHTKADAQLKPGQVQKLLSPPRCPCTHGVGEWRGVFCLGCLALPQRS